MTDRRFTMSGELTLYFQDQSTAIVAHRLLSGAFQAVGRFHGRHLAVTEPELVDKTRSLFVVKISGES